MYKLMNKMTDMYKVRPRKKKTKKFDRAKMGPLSDTSDDENIDGGRMFRRSEVDFRAIMDNGWVSGTTGDEVKGNGNFVPGKDPLGVAQKGSNKAPDKQGEEPEDTEFIYYFDPVTEKVGKISRRKCVAENVCITKGGKGEEIQEGDVKDWDGEEGKSMLIWKLKEALKGHSLKEKEPMSPKMKSPKGKKKSISLKSPKKQ